MSDIGMWNNENITPSLEGLSLGMFTRVLGWQKEEVEIFLTEVRKDMKNPKIHAYFPM